MIRTILFAVAIVLMLAAIALAVYGGWKWYASLAEEPKKKTYGFYESGAKPEETPKKPKKGLFMAGLFAFIASLTLTVFVPGSVHQVDTGTVAVVRHLGKIVDMRQPGTYFDFYMTNHYETYDTKVQQVEIVTAAYSRDGQTMELEVFLQYKVQSDHIMDIATQYGSLDALQSRIETQTIEKTKAVMSSDIAMNIIQNRPQFSNDVSEAVRAGISDDYFVDVKDVVLTNIDFTDEFERSVEAKVIAEQEKQAAETRANAEAEVARIKAEAEKTVAQIEAEKRVIEAEADAEVVRIAAKAEAMATVAKIVELAKTIGFNVIENEDGYVIEFDAIHTEQMFREAVEQYLEYLAYLEKWDGELPEVVAGDDAISIIVPNGN